MNNKKLITGTIFFIICVGLLLLVGCTKIIEIDLPNAPNKLVVNCFFSTGDKFIVHLSHSQNILNEDSTIIKNGNIKLYVNDIYQGSLKYIADGIYSHDTIIARPGIKYKLVALAPGYDQVEAEDTAPTPTIIDSVSYDPKAYPDSEGNNFYKVELLLQDNASKRDYYEIILKYYKTADQYSVIRLRGDYEQVIMNEGDEEFYSGICIFSDELINGSKYWLKMKTSTVLSKNKKELHLLSISET
jgi:predicted glutamine amidotransferase